MFYYLYLQYFYLEIEPILRVTYFSNGVIYLSNG